MKGKKLGERETEGEMGEDAEKVGKVIKFLTW